MRSGRETVTVTNGVNARGNIISSGEYFDDVVTQIANSSNPSYQSAAPQRPPPELTQAAMENYPLVHETASIW